MTFQIGFVSVAPLFFCTDRKKRFIYDCALIDTDYAHKRDDLLQAHRSKYSLSTLQIYYGVDYIISLAASTNDYTIKCIGLLNQHEVNII